MDLLQGPPAGNVQELGVEALAGSLQGVSNGGEDFALSEGLCWVECAVNLSGVGEGLWLLVDLAHP